MKEPFDIHASPGREISRKRDRNRSPTRSDSNKNFLEDLNILEKIPVTHDTSTIFYGVCLLDLEDKTDFEDDQKLVFCDKEAALQTVKKHKGARFKAFSSKKEAANFSKNSSCTTPKSTSHLDSFKDSPDLFQPVVGEKSSSFKAPRSQDSVKLRKAIECGDAELFMQTVWSNPRYLISCGDTPSILQEGFRYNALHITAKHNQAALASLILRTLEDPNFLLLLYSDDSPTITQQRRDFILDLYLNMPEKGLCETPLHFACKFGSTKVAEVLLGHPSCDSQCQNKYGKKPKEITCDRKGHSETKKQIEALFEGTFYVPVFRSEDDSVQGYIGAPYSRMDVEPPSGPVPSPRDPTLVVKAKAGPTSHAQAEALFKKWRTHTPFPPPATSTRREVRLSDSRKGLERIGRCLARELKVPWCEYWPFLETWCDLASEEGLTLLEAHLRELYRKALAQPQENPECSPALESTNATSPISQLCKDFENFHLNGSILTTSPDTPALFGIYSDSESSCDSSDNINSPVFRDRPGFAPRMNRSSISLTTRPTLLKFDHCDGDNSIRCDRRKVSNFHLEQMSSVFVTVLSDSCFFEKPNLNQVPDSILSCFKRFLKVSHRFKDEFLLNFHCDLSKTIVNKLTEDLQEHELLWALSICKALRHPEDGSQSSSDDEAPPRRVPARTSGNTKGNQTVKEHISCVLTKVELLLKTETCDVDCCCVWNTSSDTGKSVLCGSPESGDEESSEEYLTPPSSELGSFQESSDEEVFSLDEGIAIFLGGWCLSKTDLDVQNALEGIVLDAELYPHIHIWKHTLASCTKEQFKSLLTPSRLFPPLCRVGASRGCTPRSAAPCQVQSEKRNGTPKASSFRRRAEWKTDPNLKSRFTLKPRNIHDCFTNGEEPKD